MTKQTSTGYNMQMYHYLELTGCQQDTNSVTGNVTSCHSECQTVVTVNDATNSNIKCQTIVTENVTNGHNVRKHINCN